jgi:hypothetical protein
MGSSMRWSAFYLPDDPSAAVWLRPREDTARVRGRASAILPAGSRRRADSAAGRHPWSLTRGQLTQWTSV